MAEQKSQQDRTEQPTERRKQESRKKGQVPRSKELNTTLSLLVGALGLIALGGTISTEFIALFESSLSFDRAVAFDKDMIPMRLVGLIVSSVLILSPLFFSVPPCSPW